MTKICFWIVTAIIILYSSPLLARGNSAADQQKAAVSNTVASLFKALQDGDLLVIKEFMSKELYEQYRVLFEENGEYPAFLRQLYKGAECHIDKIDKTSPRRKNADYLVSVVVEFPAGEKSMTKLSMRRKPNNEEGYPFVLLRIEDGGVE